ncbi:MAG: hypothetical protein ACK4VP_06780, partial [Nitrospira sp.]
LTPPTGPSNCEPGCVYQAFGLVNDGSLSLLYKADVGTAVSESGSFASNYDTTFKVLVMPPVEPSPLREDRQFLARPVTWL